ncbi:putative T7SS-secreted protein [Klenkia sp. LSe6-5]|uniref:T7SS-secreted protein n=1 Tax=Klenkia sesuvii TaxID=3103137 RepID=A0ABU8DW64_9ACTN
MDWSALGGDPAPGSPESVDHGATALAAVASLAREAARDLRASSGRLGPTTWKGEAADAFRSGVLELPDRLSDVDLSFSQASSALTRYRDALDHAQAEARGALRNAQQAQSDLAAARTREAAARAAADAARRSQLSARTETTRLEAQQALTVDPTQRTSLQGPIATARARGDRAAAQASSARADLDRHAGAVQAAQEQLDRARARADGLRDRIRSAAEVAARALAAAEEQGHLPGFLERAYSDTKAWVVEYGPQAAEYLSLAATVLTFAAMVLPFAAPVLLGVALVVGAASLLLTIGSHAWSEEGMTAGAWLDVGLSTLGLVGTALGLGVVLKGAQVGLGTARGAGMLTQGGLQKSAALVGHLQDGTQILQGGVEGYEEDGVAGALRGSAVAATTIVAGHAFAKVSSVGVLAAVEQAHRNPDVSARLTDMGRRLRQASDASPFVVDADGTRDLQSLLAHGRSAPGGFLPGNHTATPGPGALLDHAVSTDRLHDFTEDLGHGVYDFAVEGFVEDAAAHLAEQALPPSFDQDAFWDQERR